MLMEQGHSGDRSTIMMVGDRFDTDIRAGRSAGIRTCLVESGAHKACQQREYPDDLADFIADGLGAMHALTHSPQLELPMVMRQPLRLWVLSFGNVVRADGDIDDHASLSLVLQLAKEDKLPLKTNCNHGVLRAADIPSL